VWRLHFSQTGGNKLQKKRKTVIIQWRLGSGRREEGGVYLLATSLGGA